MAQTVDEYLARFSGETLERLTTIREIVEREAPDAVESFSYGMIGYKLCERPLIYFGGFARHIGFYATPDTHADFEAEFAKYSHGKGSVQFPLDQLLPTELITRIVQQKAKQLKGET